MSRSPEGTRTIFSRGVISQPKRIYEVNREVLTNYDDMLTIRFQRTGSRNKATFRIVLAEAARSASKQAIEVLGHYNPRSKDFGIKAQERLTYWLGKHVKVSPSVYNLLVEKKLVTGKKVKAWQPKKKEGSEAPATAEAAPTPAPEAPVAETPAA